MTLRVLPRVAVLISPVDFLSQTFFIAALMAMKHNPVTVFGGAIGALALMTVLSAMVGSALPMMLNKTYTHYASVLLFLAFGVRMVWEGFRMEAAEGENSQPASQPATATTITTNNHDHHSHNKQKKNPGHHNHNTQRDKQLRLQLQLLHLLPGTIFYRWRCSDVYMLVGLVGASTFCRVAMLDVFTT